MKRNLHYGILLLRLISLLRKPCLQGDLCEVAQRKRLGEPNKCSNWLVKEVNLGGEASEEASFSTSTSPTRMFDASASFGSFFLKWTLLLFSLSSASFASRATSSSALVVWERLSHISLCDLFQEGEDGGVPTYPNSDSLDTWLRRTPVSDPTPSF